MQRVAADISARLAQIAKDPPELATYFRFHAEAVSQALQPIGLSYEMSNGQSFQRTFSFNYESLKLREAPAQELAFQRAVRMSADQGKPVFLDANFAPTEALRGMSIEDAPAPDQLAIHNQTPFQQVFVPIALSKKSVGVLHGWFAPGDATLAQARMAILAHAAGEVELYLKARRISDISQELARITTYAKFLEDVAGDQDLESVSWKLVNYAREAVGCDRVCLLVDSSYGVQGDRKSVLPAGRLTLQACSGLRRPHQRSEHAEVLKDHASELLRLAVATEAEAESSDNAVRPDRAKSASNAAKPSAATQNRTAAAGPGTEVRPQMRIIFTNRDPAKVANRPDAVNRYFETIPMNWSTVLPLYDRNNRVCGTLLFEGQQSHEKIAGLFHQMRDLAVSGGHALSTALVWQRRLPLRGARIAMRWGERLIGTSRRRLFLKYGVPGLAIIILLAYPFNYRIRGEATLRPTEIQTLAASTSSRLLEVNAKEGDRVKKGQILCVLDSSDLRLQLQSAEQERERAETEAALMLRQDRSEARMQIARLTAQKAETVAQKLRRDIELTVIRAPFDGVLVGPSDLGQRRGQIVRVGETVAEIVDPSRWEVKASVREQDVPILLTELRERRAVDASFSMPCELVLTASPSKVYTLFLSDPQAFSHRLETSGGNYRFSTILAFPGSQIEASGNVPQGELKSGYTGKIKFDCGRRPLAAILFGDFIKFLKLTFF